MIRFDPSGRFVKYSTYFGGSRPESVDAVAADRDGRVFLTGATVSTDFPITAGAVYPICGSGQCVFDWDAFLFSLREDGTLAASTFIGGGFIDYGHDVAVLPGGAVVVAGATGSSSFPLVNERPSTWVPSNSGLLPFVTLLYRNATRYERSTLIPAFHRAGTWQAFAADDRFVYTATRKGENSPDSVLSRIATR